MKSLNLSLVKKYSLLLISLLLFLLIAALTPLYLSEEKTENPNPTTKVETENSQTDNVSIEDKTGSNKVDIQVDSSTTTNQGNSTTNPSGTCKVTKNGVTTTVPADQVKINEQSDGDLNIKVDCESKVNSSTNKSSVNNDIEINTSTSN